MNAPLGIKLLPALMLCLGSAITGSALADEAPPPPPAPSAAADRPMPPPPPPPGARVERRIVVIDHDGKADDLLDDEAGDGRRDIRILRDGNGPGGVVMMRRMGPEGPGMRGPGMRGPGGPRGEGMMMRMARELDLTPAQRTQLRGIMEAARPKMEDLRGQIRAEGRKLREADPGAKGFDALVAASAKRVGELSAQLVQQRAQLQRQSWQLLTPEQRTKADAMKAEAKKRRDEMADRMERRARELRGAP